MGPGTAVRTAGNPRLLLAIRSYRHHRRGTRTAPPAPRHQLCRRAHKHLWHVNLATTPRRTTARTPEHLRARGRPHLPAGSDYFLFPRHLFAEIPEFAIGRAGWDNWMIYQARRQGWPVVDGDDTDVRHIEPAGVVVALYAKGKAKRDTGGFVQIKGRDY